MRTSRLPVNMAEQLAVGPGNRELGPENPVVPAVRVALAVLESRVVPAVQVALARIERAKPQIFLFSFVGCPSLQAGSSFIGTVSQSPCRSRRRADSHQRRRTGLWRYTRSC